MPKVRFLETRIARPDPSKAPLRFETGEEHEFRPFMQPFVDIGHAVFVDGDAPAEAAAEDPTPAAEPASLRRRPNPLATQKSDAVLLDGANRAIEIADVPAPQRDEARNGGMSEA